MKKKKQHTNFSSDFSFARNTSKEENKQTKKLHPLHNLCVECMHFFSMKTIHGNVSIFSWISLDMKGTYCGFFLA
jgi:hypothetical protein